MFSDRVLVGNDMDEKPHCKRIAFRTQSVTQIREATALTPPRVGTLLRPVVHHQPPDIMQAKSPVFELGFLRSDSRAARVEKPASGLTFGHDLDIEPVVLSARHRNPLLSKLPRLLLLC